MADYDNARIAISSHDLSTQADALRGKCRDVTEKINRIQHTLFALKLGWAGRTADEAQVFGQKWNAAMTDLFGTEGADDSGVLPAISSGVTSAAVAYSHAEDGVRKGFDKFGHALSSEKGGSSTPSGSPDDQPGPHGEESSALSENFPG